MPCVPDERMGLDMKMLGKLVSSAIGNLFAARIRKLCSKFLTGQCLPGSRCDLIEIRSASPIRALRFTR